MLLAAPWAAALLLAIQVQPEPGTQGPPAEWGGTPGQVTIEVEEDRVQDATRYTYTVRYLSVSASGSPIIRFDVGARSLAGSAELTALPTAIESPTGWRATVIPDDRSRPWAWQVAWSCEGDWVQCLEHGIKSGQTRSGFRVTVPSDGGGYAAASYVVLIDCTHGSCTTGPRNLTGKVWRKGKRAP